MIDDLEKWRKELNGDKFITHTQHMNYSDRKEQIITEIIQ